MIQVVDSALPVGGCRLASCAAGIRYKNRPDLVLFSFDQGTQVAGVFTRNAFCAAPVLVARQHLAEASPRYLLINAGNANAGTGESGLRAARQSCDMVAERFNASAKEVLPFSTGVIGEQLAVDRIGRALPQLEDNLSPEGWADASRAIMTTDTNAKIASIELTLASGQVRVTGIAKGSGMIHPKMATMLAFVATDIRLSAEQTERFNRLCAEKTFNRISVDGDTSTNDACVLAATGASGVSLGGDEEQVFIQALHQLYLSLAHKIVRDGEGATKFVTLRVQGGRDEQECLSVARSIACSPLVKTAWFASDPNWGRILAAVGNAPVESLDTGKVSIFLDDVRIVHKGGLDPDYREEQGAAVFAREAFEVRVDLARGSAEELLWTCDLSHQYVTINAEYRS